MIPILPHSVHLDAGTGMRGWWVLDEWGEVGRLGRCPELVTMPTGAR